MTWRTEATSDDRFTSIDFDPVVAPDLPGGNIFAFAYRPAAGGERPYLFVAPGYPMPDNRTVSRLTGLCDACGSDRRRQVFFVLRHLPTGGLVSISTGSLGDHLGDEVAASMLSLWVAKYERLLVTIRESMPVVGRSHFGVREVVGLAVDVIDVRGWVSRGHAHKTGETATASLVLDLLECGGDETPRAPGKVYPPLWDEIEDHRAATSIVGDHANDVEADAIMDWLDKLHRDEANDHKLTDYLHNLATVASLEYVEARHVGLLCSAVMAYRDHLKVEAHRREQPPVDPGKHYGIIDTRVECDVFIDSIENRGENEWGISLLVKMHVVPSGEKLSWWTGDNLRFDEGKQYHVRLSIKKHGEWDGVKETTVSRVMEYDPANPPKRGPRKPKEE